MNTRFDPNGSMTDYSYCRFGAEALAKLLQTIEAQIDGVEKSEDIEYVHKMRVTSRRIRAAMPLFRECFPKKSYKKWLNEIKKVTQFLGAARDLDVQISVIKNYIEQLQPTEPKTGIEALLEWHIDQRTYLQSNIINGLQELKESRVLQQTSCYCEQIIKETASTSFNLFAVREKAFWQISPKLDGFLAMEDYVHKENEILKHHEMRIRAKWLRYTMEAFAPLYQEELSEEIKMMKNFQDTLGEMHDCDVWIERIPKFINQIENEIVTSPENEKAIAEGNQDLLKFLDHIKEKRKNHYENFVNFWEKEKSKNAFEELRKNASAGFVAAGYRTEAELKNPYVKIAVIADIHANLNALEAVLQDAERRGITVFLNAGDVIGFGAFPNEVIQTLYSKNALSVIGNYDLEVLDKNNREKGPKKFALEYARKTLAKAYETYLRTLPSKLELEIAHKKLLMIHGTPDSVDEHLYHDTSEERFQEVAKTAGADIIVFGQSHEQFTKKAGETLFINPGSVGRPGDGNPQAAYAAITASPFSVELVRVSYNVEAAADALRKTGAPESYAQMLLRGLSLEDIIAEDKARESDMERKCTLMARSTRRVARKYWPDMKHSEQVRKLSLELFDALQDLHKLGKRERCWLECAAILHDIGLSQGPKAHHKKSLNLILNEAQLPFTSIERRVIGNVARYHRKGCPQYKHYNFKSLSSELRRKVTTLVGILRLADSLDFSHQSIVQNVEAHVAFENVTVQGSVLLNPVLEEYAVNKKKDVFEKSFKKKVVVAWKQIQLLQQQPCQQPQTEAQQSTLQSAET
ncbi:MAG: CHAD domain-containing protein [Candidatus Bathyarchaeia archaeon]